MVDDFGYTRLLDALELPWAVVDATGWVLQASSGFGTGEEDATGKPLTHWFPQVTWPPETRNEPQWMDLDRARRLLLFPLAEGKHLAVLQVHGTDLARMPVPAGKAFLNMLVHELRLPLTPIRGYTELMKQGLLGPVTERQTQVLDTILRNIQRADRLLDRLSLLGKVESNNLVVRWQALDLAAWLSEWVHHHQDTWQQAGLRLRLYLDKDLPPVWTDPTWLAWVLNALLENARLYTPQGGQVRLEARPVEEGVEVAVEDTGIGIAEEEQPLVFQPFFRSSDPRVRQHQGWGMDLFVAYRLVQHLGGRMGFSSQPNKGSRFWVHWPKAPEATQA